MGGFSQGFSSGLGLAQQQTAINEQQKAQERDAQAKLYENALNNPGISPGQRQQLLQGYTGLFAPHEAPNLIERLSGLIHGTAKAAGKAHQGIADALTGPSAPPPVAASSAPIMNANGAAPTDPSANPGSTAAATSTPAPGFGIGAAPAAAPISATAGSSTSPTSLPPAAHALPTGTPGALVPTPQESAAAGEPDMHPFQSGHPFLDRLNAGIHEIGDHLKGFSQPNGPPPQLAPGTGELIANAYRSPEAVEIAKEQRGAQAQLALQSARNAGLVAVANVRAGANPKVAYLSGAAQDLGYDSFRDLPQEMKDDVLADYKKTQEGSFAVTAPDPDHPGQFIRQKINPHDSSVEAQAGTIAPRGLYGTQRSNTSTDEFGNTRTSNTTTRPMLPGGPSNTATAAPVSSAAPATPASLSNLQSTVNGNRTSAATPTTAPRAPRSSRAPGGTPPALDDSGHIPSGHGNMRVTEAANQLLDGMDVNKIPLKAREAAANLARQYGWNQGLMTPIQQAQVNEATTFLKDAASNPALGVLDDTSSRLKLQQVIGKAPEHGELLKQIPMNIAAGTLNPQEQEFLRTYNQLVGTIQGLSQLTRSGRMTEAGIDRLVNELPNPYTSTSTADAQSRINRLLKEVDVLKNSTVSGQKAKGATPVSSNAPSGAPKIKVPAGYVHKDNGPNGPGWYKP